MFRSDGRKVFDRAITSGAGQGSYTAAGVFYSKPTSLKSSESISWLCQELGGLGATLSVEVSNSRKEEVDAGLDRWSTYDLLTIPALAIVELVADTDELVFLPFVDSTPSLTAVLATSAALPACTAAGSGVGKTLTGVANGALAIDGVTVIAASDYLVKNQVDKRDNGFYRCTTVGTAGTQFVLTRSTSMDGLNDATPGDSVLVSGGTQGGTWCLASPAIGIKCRPDFELARLKLVLATIGNGTGSFEADVTVKE